MDTKQGRKTAIVVGAGVGGVSTAARLAKAGFEVTVLEKNDFTGGRCSLLYKDGHRFDQGPSLLLLPRLFEEAFYDLGTSMEAEGVKLFKCEPNYHMWFSDGESFTLSTDLAQMKREVEKWEGKDGFEGYLGFMEEAHRHYEASVVHVLRKNFTTFWNMLRPSFLPWLRQLHPFESVYRRTSMYFSTERLRRVFTFGSMYMGMSPYDAPGTYSLLQYTELAEGIWYPEGGFHRIVEALVGVGERMGVKYRLSTPISSVTVSPDGRTVTGVKLESGEQLTADVVVINADLVYAYNHLLPPSPRAASLSKRSTSCSSISFYWAMDRIIPELRTHNIFLAEDYRASFDDIFDRQMMPEQPSFYVNVPSRVDPTAAPEGRDSIVVLVPVGHLLEDGAGRGLQAQTKQDWEAMVERARQEVFSVIESRTGARGLRESVTAEIVNTPRSWKQRFNLDKGAILGISHSFFNVLSFRPRTRHPDLANCYFVGASTHPGTGVPICLAGSKLTSEQILSDRRMSYPWSAAVDPAQARRLAKGGQADIDRQMSRPGDAMPLFILLSVVVLLMAVMLYGVTGINIVEPLSSVGLKMRQVISS